MKVMTRLQNITYLQTLLEKALAGEFLIYHYFEILCSVVTNLLKI